MFSQFSKKALLNIILLKSELILAFVLGICNNRIWAKGKKKRILKFVTTGIVILLPLESIQLVWQVRQKARVR